MTLVADSSPAPVWTWLFCILAGLFIAFGAQEGFEHAQVNHFRDQSVQLPILFSYADESLYPDDILLGARQTYTTFFYPLLGLASRQVSLWWLMALIYVLTTILTVSAVYALAETLFPEAGAGYIAVLLWAAWLPNVGGDYLRSAFPTHTTTAIGLQLWALVFALRGRDLPAAALLGLTANINAMTSVFIGIVWAFDLLRRYREWDWRLLRIPVVMGLCAAPILWWRFFGEASQPSNVDMATFVEVMRIRLWYAVFPFSAHPALWGLFGLVVAAWIYSACYAPPATNRRVLWMVQGITLLVLIGTIFTEFYPIELVIQLQLLRSTWVFNLFAGLYYANMLAHWLRGGRVQVALAFLLTLVLATPRLLFEFIPLANPVPFESHVDFNPSRAASPLTWWMALGVVALVGALFLSFWRVTLPAEARYGRTWRLWFGLASMAFAAPFFVNTAIPARQTQEAAAWRDMLNFVQIHTPPDARFISPPTLDGFRVHAQRSNFSDWKDGTLLIFNGNLAVEWLKRMEALGFERETFSFKPPSVSSLCELGFRYNMDYVIVFNEWNIGGQPLYRNAALSLFRLDQLTCPPVVVYAE